MRSASSAIRTDMRIIIIILMEDGKGEVDVGVFWVDWEDVRVPEVAAWLRDWEEDINESAY